MVQYRDKRIFNITQFRALISRLRHEGRNVLADDLETFAANGGIGHHLAGSEHLRVDALLDQAQSYLGVIHCMGGNTRRCMDCSGMVSRTFRDFGVPAPQGSQNLAHYGDLIIDPANLRAGDMLFFEGTYNTDMVITHSGLYMGNGKFIHTSGKFGVEIRDFWHSHYWQRHFLFGSRVIQP